MDSEVNKRQVADSFRESANTGPFGMPGRYRLAEGLYVFLTTGFC